MPLTNGQTIINGLHSPAGIKRQLNETIKLGYKTLANGNEACAYFKHSELLLHGALKLTLRS